MNPKTYFRNILILWLLAILVSLFIFYLTNLEPYLGYAIPIFIVLLGTSVVIAIEIRRKNNESENGDSSPEN